MPHTLMRPDDAAARIAAGRPLLIAGDDTLLATLPRGRWIGGSAPSPADGVLVVTELPEAATSIAFRSYDAATLPHIGTAAPGNGFTILILPGFSPLHAAYAQGVFRFEGLFNRPLVGWVAGGTLPDEGGSPPKVFDGMAGTASDRVAVAAHVALPPRLTPRVHVVNPFRPGDGDELVFGTPGFTARHCLIGGEPVNLAAYMRERGIGLDRPLVADCFGTPVNAAVRAVDAMTGTVHFCAPVFSHLRYRFAAPPAPAPGSGPELPAGVRPAFACGCVRTPAPASRLLGYGEIAYVVHNLTLAYLTIDEAG